MTSQDLVRSIDSNKQVRASTSKVRTGCSTCKSRRIKCDEGKPSCNRCLRSARICTYDASGKPTARKNIIKVYLPPIQGALQGSFKSNEIDFYHKKVAAKLSGHFDTDFWTTLVLQLCQSVPAIQHAVAAISAVHSDMESAVVYSPKDSVPLSSKAMQECSAAMQSLAAYIGTESQSNFIPLVACLLFTCLEFVRGSIEQAMIHVMSGFKILQASRQRYFQANKQTHHPAVDDFIAIERHIVPLFTRLGLLYIFFGRGFEMPPVYSMLGPADSQMLTVHDARVELFEKLDRSLRYIRQMATKNSTEDLSLDDWTRKTELELELLVWKDQFNQVLQRATISGSTIDEDAIKLLTIHHLVVKIWLEASSSFNETSSDAYTSEFAEIVALAGSLSVKPQSTPEEFSFEMQTIAPLYFTAVKCRVPSIRHRALHLLQCAPRREGLWSTHLAGKIAERVIFLEERNLKSVSDLPSEEDRVHSRMFPSGEERGKLIGGFLGEESTNNHNSERVLPDRLKFTFRTKPGGEAGPTEDIIEEVIL